MQIDGQTGWIVFCSVTHAAPSLGTVHGLTVSDTSHSPPACAVSRGRAKWGIGCFLAAMHRVQLAVFTIQNRALGPYSAASHRILVPAMLGAQKSLLGVGALALATAFSS
jgi:hypothetical protein